jgi:hypothetical protein
MAQRHDDLLAEAAGYPEHSIISRLAAEMRDMIEDQFSAWCMARIIEGPTLTGWSNVWSPLEGRMLKDHARSINKRDNKRDKERAAKHDGGADE